MANNFGLTPIAMALRNGHCDSAEVLLKTGSDPTFIWTSEQFNGQYAWIGYSHDVIQLLLIATPDLSLTGRRTIRELYKTFLCTMKSAELVKVFFLSGSTLMPEEMHHLLIQVQQISNPSLHHWLMKSASSVPTLQHACRLAIRRHLRPNVVYASVFLPLPTSLQEYLLLPEVKKSDQPSWSCWSQV